MLQMRLGRDGGRTLASTSFHTHMCLRLRSLLWGVTELASEQTSERASERASKRVSFGEATCICRCGECDGDDHLTCKQVHTRPGPATQPSHSIVINVISPSVPLPPTSPLLPHLNLNATKSHFFKPFQPPLYPPPSISPALHVTLPRLPT